MVVFGIRGLFFSTGFWGVRGWLMKVSFRGKEKGGKRILWKEEGING